MITGFNFYEKFPFCAVMLVPKTVSDSFQQVNQAIQKWNDFIFAILAKDELFELIFGQEVTSNQSFRFEFAKQISRRLPKRC